MSVQAKTVLQRDVPLGICGVTVTALKSHPVGIVGHPALGDDPRFYPAATDEKKSPSSSSHRRVGVVQALLDRSG
jgi:hypothetical protein